MLQSTKRIHSSVGASLSPEIVDDLLFIRCNARIKYSFLSTGIESKENLQDFESLDD